MSETESEKYTLHSNFQNVFEDQFVGLSPGDSTLLSNVDSTELTFQADPSVKGQYQIYYGEFSLVEKATISRKQLRKMALQILEMTRKGKK
jgi:hypothetical protein